MIKQIKYNSGITFIEMLIGLTIFSIIAASLYSVFFSSTSAWKRSEDLNRVNQEARWSLDNLSRELHNAIILSYKGRYPDFKAFEGESDKLSFFIVIDDEIRRVTYLLEPKDKNSDTEFYFKRKESFFVDSLQSSSKEESEENLSSLVTKEGLKFSYPYGAEGEDEEVEWKEKWQDRESLPAGVKIELALQSPGNPNSKTTFYRTVFVPLGVVGEIKEK